MADLDQKQEYLFWLNQRKDGESLSQTKRRVFLNLPKAEGQLRDIQLVNLYILRKIKEVCDANDLHFFLMRGTLLGTVRHQGFIPWDDDADIGILYPDYLRLKEILRENPFIGNGNYLIRSIYEGKYRPNFIFQRDAVYPPAKVIFEGLEFEAPGNWEVLLQNVYGDIWSFPPKISPHHTNEISFASGEYKELIAKAKQELQLQ